jgi:hypothetical protein
VDPNEPDLPVPTCDIAGWDCDCVEKDPIDPFSRKPTPYSGLANTPDYEFLSHQEDSFNLIKEGYGFGTCADGTYDVGCSWTPIPDGYWGHWIFLDQWFIFGYEDWEEWNFGVVIRDEQTGGYVDWPFITGAEYFNEKFRLDSWSCRR